MDYHKTSWRQSTTFPVDQSSFNGSNGIITIWNRGTMIPIRRSIWQKENNERRTEKKRNRGQVLKKNSTNQGGGDRECAEDCSANIAA